MHQDNKLSLVAQLGKKAAAPITPSLTKPPVMRPQQIGRPPLTMGKTTSYTSYTPGLNRPAVPTPPKLFSGIVNSTNAGAKPAAPLNFPSINPTYRPAVVTQPGRIRSWFGAKPQITAPEPNTLDTALRQDKALARLYQRTYSPLGQFNYEGSPKPETDITVNPEFNLTEAPARDAVYQQLDTHLQKAPDFYNQDRRLSRNDLYNQRFSDYSKLLRNKLESVRTNPRQTYDLNIEDRQSPMVSSVVGNQPYIRYMGKEHNYPVLTLGTNEGGVKNVFKNTGGVGLHEMEHVNQDFKQKDIDVSNAEQKLKDLAKRPRMSDSLLDNPLIHRSGYSYQAPIENLLKHRLGAEFPAVLSEVAHLTDAATQATGSRVSGDFKISPNNPVALDFIRREAEKHKHLAGEKTMTELLNTQSGQAWLKRHIMDLAPPENQLYDEAVQSFGQHAKDYNTNQGDHYDRGSIFDMFKQAPPYMQQDIIKNWPTPYKNFVAPRSYRELLTPKSSYWPF